METVVSFTDSAGYTYHLVMISFSGQGYGKRERERERESRPAPKPAVYISISLFINASPFQTEAMNRDAREEGVVSFFLAFCFLLSTFYFLRSLFLLPQDRSFIAQFRRVVDR